MTGFSRYSRQIALREVGVNGQSLLRDSSALVVGLGGLGSVAALYLAGAGIGRLLLATATASKPATCIGRFFTPKAMWAGTRPSRRASGWPRLIGDVALETLAPDGIEAAIKTADVVLDCTDNFPSRFKLNALCVRARKPLVSGAAIRFDGQLAVFDLRNAKSSCYACLYPDQGQAQETCEEAGVLGPVAGVIGSMQALAAMRLLLGQGEDSGKLRTWNARTLEWKTLNLKRDPQCQAH